MRKNKRFVFINLRKVILVCTMMVLNSCLSENLQNELLVGSRKLISVDPQEFDLNSHHLTFRSVLSPLVSEYLAGRISGVIADEWRPNADYTKWVFRIRKDLNFENGDPITAEAVVQSLSRIAFVFFKAGSQDNIFVSMPGWGKQKKASDVIEGISVLKEAWGGQAGDYVRFQFGAAQPKFLQIISFGLYSIVHPSDYDSVTGEWKDAKKAVSSNHYRIESWGESQLALKLREEFFPENRHPKAYQKIVFDWTELGSNSADLIESFNPESAISHRKDLKFYSSLQDSNMFFMRVMSWKTHPVLKVRENRATLRDAYLRDLKSKGLKVNASFFPLYIAGVKEFNFEITRDSAFQMKVLDVFKIPVRQNLYSSFPMHINGLLEVLNHLGAEAALTPPLTWLRFRSIVASNYLNTEIDFLFFNSAMGHEDHETTIRFMFNSTEGIQLPDETGEIKAEIGKENFSVQKINALIWEQALIWPVFLATSGFYASDRVDLSRLNLAMGGADFANVGAK